MVAEAHAELFSSSYPFCPLKVPLILTPLPVFHLADVYMHSLNGQLIINLLKHNTPDDKDKYKHTLFMYSFIYWISMSVFNIQAGNLP